ncbi:MAG TPA: redox-sensing transcriptional repressor Rex [Firmicutes bacterium]|nr:redox-sensing transcriptional repressor Rex [Bacillota bacterium]HBR28777.1 redox-sensing transcriptional repressor Rex [Bacillota bacterium]HBR33757.1 redox-sensing transcriptional repressor Rex [Bacillota bacterium]
MRKRKVPDVVIRRLPLYLRVLSDLDPESSSIVSSYELGARTGVTPGQIRKDLSFFGVFGKQGVGYEVTILREELRRILKLDRVVNAGLVGVGNLGQAFLHYGADRQKEVLSREGLRMRAAFDQDERKIGGHVAGVEVYPVQRLPELIKELPLMIIILTVPAEAAQVVFDRCVASGVKAFLNFAPVKLEIPPGIRVRHADFTLELESLAYYSKEWEEDEGEKNFQSRTDQ